MALPANIDWVALGTWVLAFATWGLFLATKSAITRQGMDSRTELTVRLHMMMEEKWDADAMALRRARLAHQLLSKVKHDDIQEAGVLEFFESLAIMDRLGLVQSDLLWNTFSFYASRWWTACREYVFEERRRQHEENVPQSFIEFEAFADRLKDREARDRKTTRAAIEPSADEVKHFLQGELALRPDVTEQKPPVQPQPT